MYMADTMNKKVELLAPAGNLESFYGAIHAGADAVYLAGAQYGARAYAENFTTQELIECIRYAHLWGRKVYLTVNTLVKNQEMDDLYDYLFPFYEAGLDAVIVQDIGVFTYIRDHFPGLELHASTQMTITGSFGANLIKSMGACRVVPARELSLSEIRSMKQETGMELECFIHGAMCYCYSGQCLFSSMLGGRSGNRGRCAQPCRLPYKILKDGKKLTKECYPLSLKDMCTIEHIPELIEAGIDSFKIEGRMKKPEYAAGVTAIYRKYIDQYYASHKVSISAADKKVLSCLYIRSERQDGYYYKHNGKDMITLDQPAYSGSDEELLEKIRQKYLNGKWRKPVQIDADFTVGDKAKVTFSYENIQVTVTGTVVEQASKQPITEENVRKQLGKLGDSVFEAMQIKIRLQGQVFYPLRALNELRRLATEALEERILYENGFVKRNTVVREQQNCSDSKRMSGCRKCSAAGDSSSQKRMHCSVQTLEQLQALSGWMEVSAKHNIPRIYVDSDLFYPAVNQQKAMDLCKALRHKTELVLSLPYIIRKEDTGYLQELVDKLLEQYKLFEAVQVRSLEELGFLETVGYRGAIHTDAGFYMWNTQTIKSWLTQMDRFQLEEICLPLELNGSEQRQFIAQANLDAEADVSHGHLSWEKIIYGRTPMMITANCIAKTGMGCQKGQNGLYMELEDRYQKHFPVALHCRQCMNIIYNSVPTSLHGELSKWNSLVDFRIDFTVETGQEVECIVDYFHTCLGSEASLSSAKSQPPYREYTTGHEKRGVE